MADPHRIFAELPAVGLDTDHLHRIGDRIQHFVDRSAGLFGVDSVNDVVEVRSELFSDALLKGLDRVIITDGVTRDTSECSEGSTFRLAPPPDVRLLFT